MEDLNIPAEKVEEWREGRLASDYARIPPRAKE